MSAVALVVTLGLPAVSAAHHVGTFVPKDSEVSANFKQIKFSIQAGKFDVALRLFDEGAIHAEMEKIETRLPAGLEDGLRAALKAKDVQGAEVRLMIFMVFVARDLAREAARRLADDTTAPSIRLPQAAKLLEAVWRYHNLVDFVLYQRDVKAALAMRLAFDDAESAVGGGGSDPMKVGGTPAPGSSGVTRTDLKPPGGAPKSAANLVRAKDALRRMTEILTRVIEQPVPSAPALPAGVGVARP